MFTYVSEEKKRENIKLVVDTLLKKATTIDNVSEITGISSSSVQRYLNDTKRIVDIYGDEAMVILMAIKARLNYNKIVGNRTGGINYASNNECLKDETGKFVGSKAK